MTEKTNAPEKTVLSKRHQELLLQIILNDPVLRRQGEGREQNERLIAKEGDQIITDILERFLQDPLHMSQVDRYLGTHMFRILREREAKKNRDDAA